MCKKYTIQPKSACYSSELHNCRESYEVEITLDVFDEAGNFLGDTSVKYFNNKYLDHEEPQTHAHFLWVDASHLDMSGAAIGSFKKRSQDKLASLAADLLDTIKENGNTVEMPLTREQGQGFTRDLILTTLGLRGFADEFKGFHDGRLDLMDNYKLVISKRCYCLNGKDESDNSLYLVITDKETYSIKLGYVSLKDKKPVHTFFCWNTEEAEKKIKDLLDSLNYIDKMKPLMISLDSLKIS